MENAKNVKSLKKQLAAAIAMVLVAAIALASSTYAWFVSNNSVKATTTTISAQSNAPFLKIDSVAVTADSGTEKTLTTPEETKLYPSQVVGDATAPKFESAYAAKKSEAAELTNSRFEVGGAEAAVTGKYAIKQTFYIGTSDDKAGSFKNLTVSSVKVNATAGSKLENAMRVLVVGEDGWVVWKKGESDTDGWVKTYDKAGTPTDITGYATTGSIDDAIAASKSGEVNVYVFYDGADSDVYTDQLANLTGCGVTITFTATPVNTDGKDVTGANNAAGN